jgi:hypothetical protein
MMYLHETTQLLMGKTDVFVDLFERVYQPLMEQIGVRLVAQWETVPTSLPWPQAITLWEMDDQVHYSKVAAAQHTDKKYAPQFREWRNQLAACASGGTGRILTPGAKCPTLADMKAEKLNATVCVHEWLTTQPDKQFDYVEQIERLWVPYALRNGRRWVGTYHTQWKNFEAISIWAFPDGFKTYGDHYSPKWSKAPTELDKADLEGWMQIAIALREHYDDGLMHALRPTPLRG